MFGSRRAEAGIDEDSLISAVENAADFLQQDFERKRFLQNGGG
jgi:hypothetical protein